MKKIKLFDPVIGIQEKEAVLKTLDSGFGASGAGTKKVAELMISLSGKDLNIQFLAPKKGDIRFSQTDISLAKKELNYSPKFDLKEIKNLLE